MEFKPPSPQFSIIHVTKWYFKIFGRAKLQDKHFLISIPQPNEVSQSDRVNASNLKSCVQ